MRVREETGKDYLTLPSKKDLTNMITKLQYKKIYNYLITKNIGFCFFNGILVSREDCEEQLGLI